MTSPTSTHQPVLKHIVIWSFKDQAKGADKATNIAKTKALLQSCDGLVPGLLTLQVATKDGDLECTHDLVLYCEFDSVAALDAYQQHPHHVAMKPFIGAVRETRACMDFWA